MKEIDGNCVSMSIPSTLPQGKPAGHSNLQLLEREPLNTGTNWTNIAAWKMEHEWRCISYYCKDGVFPLDGNVVDMDPLKKKNKHPTNPC